MIQGLILQLLLVQVASLISKGLFHVVKHYFPPSSGCSVSLLIFRQRYLGLDISPVEVMSNTSHLFQGYFNLFKAFLIKMNYLVFVQHFESTQSYVSAKWCYYYSTYYYYHVPHKTSYDLAAGKLLSSQGKLTLKNVLTFFFFFKPWQITTVVDYSSDDIVRALTEQTQKPV